MTVKEWAEAAALTVVTEGDMQRPVTGGYCGDLLSWVMGRAPADAAWFTVMGNVNAVAVAVLADIACVVLCEGAALDEEARRKAEQQGVTVLSSGATVYETALRLAERL